MIKVGLIDDEKTSFDDYATRLRRQDIELIFYDGHDNNLNSIIDWLICEDIVCVFVDYDLQKKFSKNGTDLVFGLNQLLPDFPCIMITNYPEQSKNEKLVSSRLIWDRSMLNSSDLSEVVGTIKNEVDVYLQRKSSLVAEYEDLEKKRKSDNFSVLEEERFMQLHSLFSKYGETDDIPAQLLSSQTNDRLDKLIEHLTKLLDKKEE